MDKSRRALVTAPRGSDLEERMAVLSVLDLSSGCWEWMGTLTRNGYGRLYVGDYDLVAHRASYEMYVGQIPDDLVLDHLCRNRSCVNPKHLEPVTVPENNLRGEGCMADYARRTRCPKGHPYSGDNLWVQESANGGKGARRCRACKREENKRTRARIKAAKLAG